MANNLVKVNQLDPAISGYIATILGANFSTYAALFGAGSGDFGDHVLYVTGGNQTIYGQKIFMTAPGVPYTGTASQTVSKLFVTDSIAVLQAQLDLISPNFVNTTGNQTINGIKTFSYLINAGSGRFSSECFVPFPTNGSGAINLDYLNSIGVVNLSGDQTISGNKTFVNPVSVGTATGGAHAARFDQLTGASGALAAALAASGGSLEARMHALENSGVSGFAGILSLNGISGRAYIKGCNGVTVTQDGNITRISGSLTPASNLAFLVKTPIPTGVTSYPISFAEAGFGASPVVIGSLLNTTGNAIYAHSISGVTTSGCQVYFGAPIEASGYEFHLFAGPSGLDVLSLKGDDGNTMVWRGVWQSGLVYSPLDYVLHSGASFFCAQGHLSIPANNPLVAPSYWNVALSGNGAVGPSGATGPSGLKGDGGILFSWKGEWNSLTTYRSGDGVYCSGGAYGLTGGSGLGFAQSPLNYSHWSLVINGSGVDTASFYTRDNPSGFLTSATALLKSQSGLFAPSGYLNPNGVTGIKIDSRVFSGLVNIFGTGSVVVSYLGNSIMISGQPTGSVGGVGGLSYGSFNYRGVWSQGNTYQSGDAVEWNNAGYIYLQSASVAGLNSNPSSLLSPWIEFEPRELTFHKGNFDANQIYYKNDLAHVNDATTQASVVYVWTSDIPTLALNPFSNAYNSFLDCNNVTGYNLFEVTADTKSTSHPYYGSGSSQGFIFNGHTPNFGASGQGEIVLIRGQDYFFSVKNSLSVILSTNSNGGTPVGQFSGNCFIGPSLCINRTGSHAMAPGQSVASGQVLFFTPDAFTPDHLWIQSLTSTDVGWKISVVDENPWTVFVSGAVGAKGDKGDQGDAGLAFAWQGAWNNATVYNPYDAVFYNGSSWGTLNPVTVETPNVLSSNWKMIAQSGQPGVSGSKGDPGLAFVWRGAWDGSKVYKSGEAIYFNGSSFGTNIQNNGKSPALFPATWFTVAASGSVGPAGAAGLAFSWRGDWSSSETYHSGESVYYAGSSYGTFNTITSTPPDLSPWFIIAQRGGTPFSWRGVWNSGTQYYANDAVFFSGSSYATTARTSGNLPADGGNWFLTAAKGGDGATGPQGTSGYRGPGFVWKSIWDSGIVYSSGDVVSYNGSAYLALSGHNSGIYPTVYPFWETFVQRGNSPLFSYQGLYDSGIGYSAYDMVYWEGSSYSTLINVTSGDIPGIGGNWFRVAFGFNGAVVLTSGTQSISGIKTFYDTVIQAPREIYASTSSLIDGNESNHYLIHLDVNNFSFNFTNLYYPAQNFRVTTLNEGTNSGVFNGSLLWENGVVPGFTTGDGGGTYGIDVWDFYFIGGLLLAKKFGSGYQF